MLWRVTGTNDDAPGVRSYFDEFAICHAPIAVGQRMDVLAKLAEPGLVVFNGGIAPARAFEKGHTVIRRFTAGIGCEDAAVEVLQPSHPQAAIELAGKPTGHADVIRMHVGGNDAGQRALIGTAGKYRTPGSQRIVSAHSCVHHGPAALVFQAPDIDVIELHRQRHAHPNHAGCDLQRLAGFRRRIKRIHQRGFDQPFPRRR